MRVTQSMLSSNMLRNLNVSYGKMSKYQEQLTSGKKVNRPSDDPVIAVKGMGYRVDLDKVEQFQRNLNEVHSWNDATDEALDQVGSALHRVQELVTNAANDTNTPEEREKINAEIKQIQLQMRDIANSKVGENYIFTGTHTNSPLFNADGTMANGTGIDKSIQVNVFDGISMDINLPGQELFKGIDEMISKVSKTLENPASTGEEIGALLTDIQLQTNKVLEQRAVVGARQNRAEMMENRLSLQEVNVTKQLSENEDTDYAKTITEMVTTESIHQASLSVGAKIIQQSLVDFIR
ncbi:flagellar hook-associated protein FlgL [Solibacillus sp. MA9]|uniref:Flagellar hook-associated protein FlgL n=1 Tax=Solibacillus palustris TaxID=2908203 RepID=A0ABS9U8H4_9BACL|nr:flagellar hook-associated protein FlgL [Solibacillus sp. MA9]MCH7320646.1 flagellar hook-associated protein FlgL [Solibacillus sp. MA9]